MTEKDPSVRYDEVWEELYTRGENVNRYPHEGVISFIMKNCPPGAIRAELPVLEVGFGAGNNLWFAAREGFPVAGVDGSPSAVAYAKERFAADGLVGDLRVGTFDALPFASNRFAFAINRGALPCVSFASARRAVDEVHRTLKPGGLFFNTLYSDHNTSQGDLTADGMLKNIRGNLAGIGQIAQYGKADVYELFAQGWVIVNLVHVLRITMSAIPFEMTGLWEFVARKA